MCEGLCVRRVKCRLRSELPNTSVCARCEVVPIARRTPGTPAGPQLLSRAALSAKSQHAKLLPSKTFDPHLVEVVLFQEFAEQICRKYLILQPLQAIFPNALCDDLVQRRGADFIRNGPQEPNVPGFLADKAKSQAQIAISVTSGALFEAFPNCTLLSISHSFGWVMAFIEV